MDLVADFLAEKVWAVVGATNNIDKFGYKIYRALLTAGYEVYPVNPGVSEIDGAKCYAKLADLPKQPDAVDIVVPPRVGVAVIEECAALGIKKVWLQPGANSKQVAELARGLGLIVIDSGCVMAELRAGN